MAKPSDNFLRGWCRQLRIALDEGTELAYETAELVEESLDLLADRDPDPEMGQPDVRDRSDAQSDADGTSAGHAEDDVAGISGVGGGVATPRQPPVGNDDTPGVPRGTSGRTVMSRDRLVGVRNGT